MNTNSASESPIRIYVLEQNRLLREAFVQLLRKRSSLTVVGDSDDCSKAYGELTAIQCDVLLLNSLEILQVIRQKAETAECLKQTKLLLSAGRVISRPEGLRALALAPASTKSP